MPSRPNILFLITDQQRHDTIAALGNPVIRTPALDRLATGGTAFTRAMTPSPECVPARCCFTHGQYPAQTGCYGNGFSFPTDGRETFMAALTRAGYRTHGIGKYHFEYDDPDRRLAGNGFETREIQEELTNRPEKDDYMRFLWSRGFRAIADPHGVRGDMYYMPQPAQMPADCHPSHWVGGRGEAFVREQAGADRPWFAFVSFIHPHPPFCPPSPWHKLYRDVDVPPPHMPPDCAKNWIHVNRFQNRYKRFDRGWDLHRVRMMRAYYYACVSFVDFQIGRILAALDETGQAANTLILFASDHGELLGDFGCAGKRSYHDAASRIPLLLRWPGVLPEGRRCATPASLLDVTRTLLESASARLETHQPEGENLVGLATNPDRDRILFTQLGRRDHAIHTAVSRRWKYVYSAPDHRELLFDLERDPGEALDLAANGGGTGPRGRAGIAEMKPALLDHLRALGETDGLDGAGWKEWPRATLPENPDAGLLYQDHPWAAELERIPGYSA